MRPYFAIIKDSFRAAMASRILYLLLLLITLVLLVVAPLHIHETLDWELQRRTSIRVPARLVVRLVEKHETDKSVGRIWESLPTSLRKKMTAIVGRSSDGSDVEDMPGLTANTKDESTHQRLVGQLNRVIKDPEFYRESDWEGVMLPTEAEDLIALGVTGMSTVQSRRLNRLLIATAVSPEIERGQATAIGFKYAIWETPLGPFGMTRQQFAQMLTTNLPWFFDKFVMSIGLLIAILVTANMIPETFQSGTLNLLLSKPVSRWGMYIAKFIGGCVFVTLCTSYLFVGFWAWLGLGMGVWDRAILLSIPLYVIVFAIYFSVSALVGLMWRSAIVSVILTLMFWALCFAIGSGHGFFNTKMKNSETVGLLPVNEQVLATDFLHQLNSWKDSTGDWDTSVAAELGEQAPVVEAISYMQPLREEPLTSGLASFLAPVYDRQNSQIISSRFEIDQGLASGKKTMLVSSVEPLRFTNVGHFPPDTVRVFATKQGVVATTAAGFFFRLNQVEIDDLVNMSKTEPPENSGDESGLNEDSSDQDSSGEEGESEASEDADQQKGESDSPKRKIFESIGPENPVGFRTAGLIDYSQLRDEFATYRAGVISVFRADGDSYEFYGSLNLKLDFNKNMSCQIAWQGDLIVLAFGNGQIITVDGSKLTELEEFHLESRSGVQAVEGDPGGRYFGVLYRNGNLWILDREDGNRFSRAAVSGQGTICSFAFGDDSQLWVTSDADRVTGYDLANGATISHHVPAGTWVAWIFRTIVRPLYTICPKPGEFYKVVTHLSSSGDSESNQNVDYNQTKEASSPWAPLTSGLVFMLVMLACGCWMFQYKDY